MAAAKSTSGTAHPSGPEPPSGDGVVELSTLAPRDEWEDARIVGADLVGVRLEHLRLDRCEVHRTVFTTAQLPGLALVDVLATDCELSGAVLHEASLLRVELRNCRLAGVDLSGARLRDVRFVDCKLDGANFRFATAERMELDRGSVVDADFTEATFTSVTFDRCDLDQADFTRASMAGTRLSGSKLDGVRGVASMRGAIVAPEQVIPLALSLLGGVGIEIEGDSPS